MNEDLIHLVWWTHDDCGSTYCGLEDNGEIKFTYDPWKCTCEACLSIHEREVVNYFRELHSISS